MSTKTNIAWTDHTFNPWWGCRKVSPGCAHCYAEAFSKRTGHDLWSGSHRFFGEKHWQEPHTWNRAAEKSGVPAKVFCGSMCDWAEDAAELDDGRDALWDLIRETPWLRWQLLTKRPENIATLLPGDWFNGFRNVWIGTSVENTDYAGRLAELRFVPAAVRFVSYEPAIGPLAGADLSGIHWLIAGGESGPRRRPFDIQWARHIRDQCKAQGLAFFFKQSGGLYPGTGDTIDGKQYKEFPI